MLIRHLLGVLLKGVVDSLLGEKIMVKGLLREHAALAPKYLGIKAIIAKSFTRIHMANLVNFGILPLTFDSKDDYAGVDQGDKLDLATDDLKEKLLIKNLTKGTEFKVNLNLSEMEKSMVRVGGKLAAIKAKQK